MALVKETATTKLNSTVEVHLRTALTPARPISRCATWLCSPTVSVKRFRVLVFAQGEGAANARAAGANMVADDNEILKKIEGGALDFDVAIATRRTRWARSAASVVCLVPAA